MRAAPALAREQAPRSPLYRDLHGETDLLEGSVRWRGGTLILGGVMTVLAASCMVAIALLGARLIGLTTGSREVVPSLAADIIPRSDIIITNTPRRTIILVTVTPAPPTATRTFTPAPTPTQGPCIQQVQPGDSLIAILSRCGHRDYETVVQNVLELNGLPDPNQLSIGQVIEVPWPSPTFLPNMTPSPTPVAGIESEQQVVVNPEQGALASDPVETLQPGVTWHQVQKDENIISIAFIYGANLQIMSELNPEITFSQCDFGSGSGGPNCVVQVYEGQLLRVPAPTPTPTIQPTSSGSETPISSVTATFNAPMASSPSDKALFGNSDLITLRWVSTGTLSPSQQYLVVVINSTTGEEYRATTRDLSFIIPEDWHNLQMDRSDYLWNVAVVEESRPEVALFRTEPRQFTWRAR